MELGLDVDCNVDTVLYDTAACNEHCVDIVLFGKCRSTFVNN